MSLIPMFEIRNIMTYKSTDNWKIKIILVCATHNVNKNNKIYNRIEHAGQKSKSGWPVRQYSTSGTLFLLFVEQTCQNIARISSISLVN